MNGSTWARTGIAGAVAGLGLAMGGVAIASAVSTEADKTSVLKAYDAEVIGGFGGGPHGHGSLGGPMQEGPTT